MFTKILTCTSLAWLTYLVGKKLYRVSNALEVYEILLRPEVHSISRCPDNHGRVALCSDRVPEMVDTDTQDLYVNRVTYSTEPRPQLSEKQKSKIKIIDKEE